MGGGGSWSIEDLFGFISRNDREIATWIAHLVQSGRSAGAVAPGGVAVRVESLVALLSVLLLFRSHDVCLHPRAQFRPEHVAHECRLTERRLVENAQVDRGLLPTIIVQNRPRSRYLRARPLLERSISRWNRISAIRRNPLVQSRNESRRRKLRMQKEKNHREILGSTILSNLVCENSNMKCYEDLTILLLDAH